jgi:peptidoglycan/LPS O-acetylase OafA/YrhL
MPSTLTYRREIDGLRGLAVIAVIVFHALPAWCPGGFVGVDIFFVLSGYLITGIVLADVNRQAFSFAAFYDRRIRRLFPALVIVLIACLALGWFFLFPHEWRDLVRNVLAGAGFFTNVLQAHERGYFDATAHPRPLLHLWSLGIEEQFYLLWPVTLVVLSRWPRWLSPSVVLLAAISFALNVRSIEHSPVTTFYHPATRMWELLAGAAVARFAIRPVRHRFVGQVFGLAGLVVCLLCFWLIEPDRFPGWWALAPVAGTVLILGAGSDAWLNRRVLACRPMVFVGLISYPLYLWHWPLLVFAELLNQTDLHLGLGPGSVLRAGGVALAFLLSWATYNWVERPIRASSVRTPFRGSAMLLASMALLAFAAAVGARAIGPRLDSADTRALADILDDQIANENWKLSPLRVREVSSAGPDATLFVGDSHMAQYEPRIEAAIAADSRRPTAVFATSGSCAPLPGMNSLAPGFRCQDFYEYWSALARQPRFSTIAIGTNWWLYDRDTPNATGGLRQNAPEPQAHQGRPATTDDFNEAWRGLEATIRALVVAGKRVVLIGSVPVVKGYSAEVAVSRVHTPALWRLNQVPWAEAAALQLPTDAKLRRIADRTGAEIIWPMDYLCHIGVCPTADLDGSPLYVKDGHLRATKAATLAAYMDDLVPPATLPVPVR